MVNDLRLALRGLGKNAGFATVAIVTLALGIGASTAMFSVVNGVLLRSLPYPSPDRVIASRVREPKRSCRPGVVPGFRGSARPKPELRATRRLRGLDDVGNLRPARGSGSFGRKSRRASFGVLGVEPAVGRLFSADEHRTGERVAVVRSRAYAGISEAAVRTRCAISFKKFDEALNGGHDKTQHGDGPQQPAKYDPLRRRGNRCRRRILRRQGTSSSSRVRAISFDLPHRVARQCGDVLLGPAALQMPQRSRIAYLVDQRWSDRHRWQGHPREPPLFQRAEPEGLRVIFALCEDGNLCRSGSSRTTTIRSNPWRSSPHVDVRSRKNETLTTKPYADLRTAYGAPAQEGERAYPPVREAWPCRSNATSP